MLALEQKSQEELFEQSRVMQYLSLFNEIDKHFDKVLGTDKFLPYNDKLKQIAEGKFPISRFVKLYRNDLKYFGELRNHISHGLKVNEYIFAIPTEKAIEKLSNFVEKVVEPPLCVEFFKKEVYSVSTNDLFKDLLSSMKKKGYTYVPVYDLKEKFLGIVTESGILQWLSDQMLDDNFLDLTKVRIEHLPISTSSKDYIFVSAHTNIYQADEIFSQRKMKGRGLGAMFITQNGTSDEKIIGIISGNDVALLDDFMMQ